MQHFMRKRWVSRRQWIDRVKPRSYAGATLSERMSMKWAGRLMTSVAAVLFAGGGAFASTGAPATSADTAWAAAVKSDSLEAYAAFVMTHPDSEHARAAYDRLTGATP